MKLNPSRRGVALVIVLSMLVLMSAVLVAFMGTVSTERAAQRAAYSSFEAQQAAESAVNLVISQIREATRSDDGNTGWASQPGLIRTFGSGTKSLVYKLYSAENMQESESSYEPDSPEESGIRPGQLGETEPGFVNINEPVLTPGINSDTVDPHYPIVDPRAALSREGRAASPGRGRVEGFWVPQSIFHSSRKKDSDGIPIMEVPMRVRWLYQLKDGTMIAADPDSQEIPKATKDNPPVARVAFWTDDETSKLNINTAGENTYWDTPMASTQDESGNALSKDVIYTDKKKPHASLAASQPTQGEYQRYPGHPATTSLSPALRWLYPETDAVNDYQFKEALYRLLPRIRGGGGTSMGGTRANDDQDLGTKDYRVPKRDRLFASLDEFWFRPDRSPISDKGFFGVFREDSTSVVQDPSRVDLNVHPRALEQLRFFLTAHSRSPDLNPFGMPKVSIWPVHEIDDPIPSNSRRSGFDDLMSFCASVSKKSYYFTRINPWSTTQDLKMSGTRPNDPIPGQPERNRKLLFAMGSGPDGYLQRMGKKPIPGVGGGTLAGKYGAQIAGNPYTEYERILLTMFDYIRTTNLVDTGRKDQGTGAAGFKLAYTPGYSNQKPPNYERNGAPVVGSGQVIPSVVHGSDGTPLLKGFGRFVNLSEIAMLFYRDNSNLPGDDPLPAALAGKTHGTHFISIRCVLLPEMWTVSPGYSALSEGYAYRVTETTPFKVSDPNNPTWPTTQLSLANNDINFVNTNPWRMNDGRFFMPTLAWNTQFAYDTGSYPLNLKKMVKPNAGNTTAAYANYPFYSKRFYVVKEDGKPLGTKFKMEPGELEFKFYPLDVSVLQIQNPPYLVQARETEMIQRVKVAFPEVTLPVPADGATFQSRIAAHPDSGSNGRNWVLGTDVIRSMESNGTARGDLRHIAGLADVPPQVWGTSGANKAAYGSATVQVHNFRNGWGRPFSNAVYGQLTAGATRRGDKISKVPGYHDASPTGSAISFDGTVPGDFDRGMSKHLDGPFINKPDEGNTRFKLSDRPGEGGHLPYFRGGNGYEEVGQTYFSPNRLVSSPVMFGSLPTGIFSGRPWETLLFCPPTTPNHRGAASPADHYFLELFHMPVVEPYAISEPLSTAGKINLNCRLAPFSYVKVDGRSYIQRHTGLYGIFKGMKQFLMDPVSDAAHGEAPLSNSTTTKRTRFKIDPELVAEESIEPYLDSKDYFKYPSEICELDLPLDPREGVGTSLSASGRRAFWTKYHMTGDNARERPYSHIYPRLTTKSNVYTVHVWAQSITKNPSAKKDDWNKFDEANDRVLGEYRGSTTIERFIDADDVALANYDPVENPNDRGLDPYYRFRIINQKRFTPN